MNRQAKFALEKYISATNSHDFDQVAELLAADATYFFNDDTCSGIQIREYFERTWAIIPDEVYSAVDVEWVGLTDTSATALYRFKWAGTLNGEYQSGQGRATNVFILEGQQWKLAHEHLSSLPKG